MGNFNRNGSDRGRNFGRPNFGGRSSERPTMHQAVCSNCGKSCQVPFEPTNGKPIYCSDCFEANGGGSNNRRSDSRGPRRSNFDDKQMFDAVCNECGKNCKVPFEPRNGKPVYCSNC